MYERERVEQERLMWQGKPQLRLLKMDYYARVKALLPAGGRVVEIGSGCGGMKEFLPRTIASDIFSTPWVDLAMSAERLALAAGSVDALVGLDVLHHLENPLAFFGEAARVLSERGRLILLEPYVSAGSWIPWHLFHHEACTMREPFALALNGGFERENNARATLWFVRHRKPMERLIRPFRIAAVSFFDLFYYPATGGFRSWSLIPSRWASRALALDRRIGRRLGRVLGYRILVALDKEPAPCTSP